MRFRTTILFAIAAFLALIVSSYPSHAQGTVHIRFDGPPQVPSGGAWTTETYSESGMQFRLLGNYLPGDGVTRLSSGYYAWPDNNTVFLNGFLGTTNTLTFSSTDGGVFDLLSMDLAEQFGGQGPVTVQFAGYRFDGTVITADFTTDGVMDGTGPLVDFQTFNFSPEFTGLNRVEIPSHGWSLDNLYVSVPEPGTWTLLILGSLLIARRCFKLHSRRD